MRILKKDGGLVHREHGEVQYKIRPWRWAGSDLYGPCIYFKYLVFFVFLYFVIP